MYRKLTLLTLLILIGFMVNTSFADAQAEISTIIFTVWNDTLQNDPGSRPLGLEDRTGCPPNVYNPANPPSDTVEQIHFPDTLVWADTILARLEWSGDMTSGTPCSVSIQTPAFYHPGDYGDSLGIPPDFCPTCCTLGVYAKARTFDASSGQYSVWVDINTTNTITVLNSSSPPSTVLMVQPSNFKSNVDFANLSFDNDVDTLILFVWDCDDTDIPGTAGEFAVFKGTLPGVGMVFGPDIYLNRYQNCIDMGIEEKRSLPLAYALEQNQPNPFNSATQIAYALPEDASVKIEITNILGNKVRTLVDGHESAGYKRVLWNGLDDSGKEVPSGVYFYTIRANDFTARNRAILMK